MHRTPGVGLIAPRVFLVAPCILLNTWKIWWCFVTNCILHCLSLLSTPCSAHLTAPCIVQGVSTCPACATKCTRLVANAKVHVTNFPKRFANCSVHSPNCTVRFICCTMCVTNCTRQFGTCSGCVVYHAGPVSNRAICLFIGGPINAPCSSLIT